MLLVAVPPKPRLIVFALLNVTPPLLTDTVDDDASASAIDAGLTDSAQFGSSSSVIVTVVVAGLPSITEPGSVPNVTVTISSSSTRSSSPALKLNVADVAPRAMVTFAGTPE